MIVLLEALQYLWGLYTHGQQVNTGFLSELPNVIAWYFEWFFFIWSKSYHSSTFRWSALMACSTDHVDGTMLYVVILLKTIKTTTKEKKVYNHLKSRMFYSLFGICLQKQVSFLRSSSASSAATNDSRWVHVTQMYWTQKRSIRSGSSCMLFIHEVVNSLIIYWESMMSSIS